MTAEREICLSCQRLVSVVIEACVCRDRHKCLRRQVLVSVVTRVMWGEEGTDCAILAAFIKNMASAQSVPKKEDISISL